MHAAPPSRRDPKSGPIVVFEALEHLGTYQPLLDAISEGKDHHAQLANKNAPSSSAGAHERYVDFYSALGDALSSGKDLRAEGETSNVVGEAFIEDLVDCFAEDKCPPLSHFAKQDGLAMGTLFEVCVELGLVESWSSSMVTTAEAWTWLILSMLEYFNGHDPAAAKRIPTSTSIYTHLADHITKSLESVVLLQHRGDAVCVSIKKPKRKTYDAVRAEALLAIDAIERLGTSGSAPATKSGKKQLAYLPLILTDNPASPCYSAPYKWPLAQAIGRIAHDAHNFPAFVNAWKTLGSAMAPHSISPAMLRSCVSDLFKPFYDSGQLKGGRPPRDLADKIWPGVALHMVDVVPDRCMVDLLTVALRYLCERLGEQSPKERAASAASPGGFVTFPVENYGCAHIFLANFHGCTHKRHLWLVGEDYGFTFCATSEVLGAANLYQGPLQWQDIKSIRKKPTKWSEYVDVEIWNDSPGHESDAPRCLTGMGELHLRMRREVADSMWEWVQTKAPGLHFQDPVTKKTMHVTACEGRCKPPPTEPHNLRDQDHTDADHTHDQGPLQDDDVESEDDDWILGAGGKRAWLEKLKSLRL